MQLVPEFLRNLQALISPTDLITFNTAGKTPGQLYNAAIAITDAKGAKIVTDFIIKIIQPTNPPIFDYALTLIDGETFRVYPGQLSMLLVM